MILLFKSQVFYMGGDIIKYNRNTTFIFENIYSKKKKKNFDSVIFVKCTTITLYRDLTMGLMKRSYFGGLRVKPSPTKQTFVTILFHAFFCLFPVLITLSTSVSPWARTLGRGTSHLPCKRHYTFELTNPWHLHLSLLEY